MKFEKVERMLRQDFEVAKVNHDFSEMADDYELLRELWATGELDSEEYHKGIPSMVHCFAELKDNKIELPSVYKSCVKNVGKKVIYSLESDCIKIVMDNVDDKIFEYFKEEGIETKYIMLENYLVLNALATKTLRIHNGDVMELCIDDEMITITIAVNCKLKCNTCLYNL